ncbi:isochorismatase family protein [Thermobifida halotolerans]|uniref:Isochorismatase family protein n=1 Tax=Thermobifida halotolerans TaxID=483545 RepID=A0A399FXB9_9ACTN|nr:isochorismatase family protein [Thermobifida halotolerans]UOE21263.1 isochorismatase family protein [Thermobifida halotolerans]
MAGIPPIRPYSLPTREQLPDNLVRWTPRPERAVLLVHDMQHYFLRAFPEPLRTELVHNAAQLRKHCAALGVPVAYTAQPGRMTPQQRGLLADFWGPGMRTDPADSAVVPELTPTAADWTFTKWRYSAFHGSDLLERMREAGRDQLLLCGVYAHVGVLATALDAFTNDIQPFLVADALGDFHEDDHRFTLDYVARRCGKVVTAEEVFA